MNKFSVTVSYPHNFNNITNHFMMSLVGLVLHETSKNKQSRILGSILNEGSCYVDFNRGRIVSNFLNYSNDSHLLMVDPDIAFAKDLLEKFQVLIEQNPQVGILAARVDIRNGLPIFYLQHPDGISTIHQIQPFLGVREFDYVGTGVILLSREVLFDLYTKVGHVHLFSKVIEDKSFRILGDDLSFCKLAREKGHKVYGTWEIYCQHWKEFPVPSRYPSSDEVKITKR